MTLSNNAPKAHLRDVLDAVLVEFPHLKLDEVLSPCRRRAVARPRQIAMALSRELGGQSLPQIGRFYDGRDHTTVLHACRRIAALREADKELDMTVAALQRRIMESLTPDSGEGRGFRQRLRQAVQADPELAASAQRAAAKAELTEQGGIL